MQGIQPDTGKEAFRQIRMLFYTILIGILMALVISIVISRIVQPLEIGKTNLYTLFTILCLIVVIWYPFSFMIFSKKITAIRQSNADLINKFKNYRAALVFYLAVYEAMALVSLVMYALSGKTNFLFITGLVVVSIIRKRPDKYRIINELQLNSSEQLELN